METLEAMLALLAGRASAPHVVTSTEDGRVWREKMVALLDMLCVEGGSDP